MLSVWRIVGGVPLRGTASVPGDKSIAHRALMFAAIAEGTSSITNLPDGDDVFRTIEALRALGVVVETAGTLALVHGVGVDGLRGPSAPIHCGNSGTTLRLLAGLLAGRRFDAVLDGDASLRARPMRRLLEPLRAMGAHIEGVEGEDGEVHAPLRLRAGPLRAADHTLSVSSAQVKGALLLAGLRTNGTTAVREPLASRDHTERLMSHLGLPVLVREGAVLLDGLRGATIRPLALSIPGDFSSATFLCVAAALIPGSDLLLSDVGTNPTRTGAMDVLLRMGARVATRPSPEAFGGEPRGDLTVEPRPLSAVDVRGALALRAVDEIPVLCVAAAFAAGTSTFADLRELRHKESDRIASVRKLLGAMGARILERPDGLTVHGPTPLSGARHPAGAEILQDHRMAMTLAVAALAADGESEVPGATSARTSFPRFAETLVSLGVKLTTVERPC